MAARETFGPILAIYEVPNDEEGIRLANSLPYGLTASVWSQDLDRATRVARRIDAGTRAVNMTVSSLVQMPWGGRKKSGIGRMLSKEGVREFAEVVTLRLPCRD
jgi:succinate-semialdehyde dehydrogenase/glutarate-semialdehyde dehydrogenase